MERVLITGVSGYIGSALAAALDGHPRVQRIVGTDLRPPDRTPDKCVFLRMDVRDPMVDVLREYRIDTVVHAAYVLAPIHDTRRMEAINVRGTQNMVDAAAAAGAGHFLYTSSTTAYGFHPDNDRPLTEDSPLRGNRDFTYAKNKREIERLLADARGRHPDMTITILRPCFVVGPHMANPLSRYLQKKWVPIPRITQPLQFVHEDDLIRVMVHFLESPGGGNYNVTGEGTVSLGAMIRRLGNRPLRVPFGLLWLLNQAAWLLRLRFLTEFPSAALNMMRYSWVASSDKLASETGLRPRFDSRGAFDDFADAVMNPDDR